VARGDRHKRERRAAKDAANRQVSGVSSSRRVGKGRRKPVVHEAGWNLLFRNEGTPDDTRHANFEEAEACRRRVRRMTPDRTKGKKESGGRRPNPITAERIVHSQGKLFEKFIESLGVAAEGWTDYQKLQLMDSRKNGGLEVFATWKQSRVEGWRVVGSWKVFRGSFQDAETGEKFDHKGFYIFKKDENGEWVTVQWEMELTVKERGYYLPKSHPLNPLGKGKKKSRKGGRVGGTNLLIRAVETSEVDLGAFAASLGKK